MMSQEGRKQFHISLMSEGSIKGKDCRLVYHPWVSPPLIHFYWYTDTPEEVEKCNLKTMHHCGERLAVEILGRTLHPLLEWRERSVLVQLNFSDLFSLFPSFWQGARIRIFFFFYYS